MPGAPPGGTGAPGSGSAGATAVGGSWLPPDISAVLASGVTAGGGVASPDSLNCGANTVSGNGTERSSPASALVSVPAHGVAPADTPASAEESLPPAAGHAAPLPGPAGTPGAGVPEPEPAPEPESASGEPAPAVPEAEAEPSPRRSGIPSRSAASCNHSGGLNKNDV
ncbi:hypothetical protein SUDANB176_03087 [Streptomyces sp. enrichment culture]